MSQTGAQATGVFPAPRLPSLALRSGMEESPAELLNHILRARELLLERDQRVADFLDHFRGGAFHETGVGQLLLVTGDEAADFFRFLLLPGEFRGPVDEAFQRDIAVGFPE